jgi:hypothetical protein
VGFRQLSCHTNHGTPYSVLHFSEGDVYVIATGPEYKELAIAQGIIV